tara:strand:+ start:1372 stop:1815 length:444 start_codon:yes stop_codon:yes gene_type:complete
MDNATKSSDLEGTREKCIYTLKTFVNQDGFKIEEHTPINENDGSTQFYGFYLVNTEIGPIDRYFRFEDHSKVEDCFDNFRALAETDAENLAEAMKRESEMLDAQSQAEADSLAAPHSPPPTLGAPDEPPTPEGADTQVYDEKGFPIT